MALGARLIAIGYELWPGFVPPNDEQFIFPYSLFVLLSGVGPFVGLILVGLDIFRAKAMRAPWHISPLGIGVLPIPMAIFGVVHLELPIFMIGLTWIALGVIILRRTDLSVGM